MIRGFQFGGDPPGSLGHKIKSFSKQDIDSFLEGYIFKTKCLDHQARAFCLGITNKSFIFPLDMGLGKTKLAIDLIVNRAESSKRALVICPPAVMHHWSKQVSEHSDLTCDVVAGSAGRKQTIFLGSKANILIVSISWIFSYLNRIISGELVNRVLGLIEDFSHLVIDEGHLLRNPESVGFNACCRFFSDIEYRYILTGTPFGNRPEGIWSQYFLLDKGETYGDNYEMFLLEFFSRRYMGGYDKFTLKGGRRSDFINLFWKKAARWRESECADLPSKNYITLDVDLSADERVFYDKVYLAMTKEQNLSEDEISKKVLRPGMGGAIFSLMRATAGVDSAEIRSSKIQALLQLVSEVCIMQESQFIIWVWLNAESDLIVKAIKSSFKSLKVAAFRGGVSEADKKKAMGSWRAKKLDVLVANQSSLGVGVDLYEANRVCFFSNSLDIIHRQQSEKRVHRIGQKKNCFIYDLVVENTVDWWIKNLLVRRHAQFREVMGDNL